MMDFFSSFLLFVLCCLLHHLTNYKKKTQKKTWMLITVKFGFNTIHKTSSVIAIQITTSPECQLFCSLFMPISSQIINHQSGDRKSIDPNFLFSVFLLQHYLTLPLFLVGHDIGYYGPPFFPVGSNFCASVYVHSCISGDVSQPSASLPSSTAFAIYHAFCDYTL